MTISEYEDTRKSYEALRKEGFLVRITERDIGFILTNGVQTNRVRVTLTARKPGFRNPPDFIGVVEEKVEPETQVSAQ